MGIVLLEFFTIIIRNGSIFQLEDSFDRGKIGPDNIHYKYVEFYGHVNDPFDYYYLSLLRL